MQFTKLFSSILDSTIWQEPSETKIVWITLLAMVDRSGEVHASIPGLASRAKVTLQQCETALESFLSPDKYSRTKENEGRRIKEIDGGWKLLNHGKYRALLSAEERKEYNRRKQAEYRAEKKRASNDVNDRNTQVIDNVSNAHITEAEAEAEANTREREREEPALALSSPTPKTKTDPSPPTRPPAKSGFHDRMPSDAANDFDALFAQINGMHPTWKKRPHPTHIEMETAANNSKALFAIEAADWDSLRAFYAIATFPPEWEEKAKGGPFWRPESRSRFIEGIADILGHHDRWQALKRKGGATA